MYNIVCEIKTRKKTPLYGPIYLHYIPKENKRHALQRSVPHNKEVPLGWH